MGISRSIPLAEAGKLYLAVDEAQALAAEFNQRAEITRLQVFVIIGRVAQDDVQVSGRDL